ncbi:DUF1120 domain-containing protein [Salmonella enterica subsp. enterica serovar Typhimurium]|nr:DUF1120 domain-containing protein [Salmonella enterica subsp. enterica serovar Typhimurium]EBY9287918.1 DUF1120 domain-containing protein [Salmonella enterica subsp. enterica serovar Typhimurium]EDK1317009.1 hypothetical protein [Salmonella enterica subsp. enterica serovar Typhimurium]EEG4794418.1 DUF1120 domain-containing protein [Salmonella enterica subsp. enterica serovar Typhimurium]MJP92896.1 hypothetical protein [Salmonella enterica subsp. enterica serovar Typhimurium]
MKKLLIATSVVIGLSTSAQAVESTAVLKLTGVLTNGACIPELSDGGVVDFGTKAVSDLLPTETNQLGYKDITLTIQCLAPAKVGWTAADNHADSVTSLTIDNATFRGQNNRIPNYQLGLGTTAGGINIGAYGLSMDLNNATADGVKTEMVVTNSSNPGYWAIAGNEYVALTNTFPTINTYSVGDENGPVAFTIATFPIRVAAAIQGTDTLAITDNTTLDGQATFTLVYL